MSFIIIITLAIYFVMIAWSWHSLGKMEKTKKIGFIAIGTLLMYVITLIIFNFSKIGVNYENSNILKNVKNVLVAIFTGINGIIIVPQLSKIIDKMREDEIDKKRATKKTLLILIIFIICTIFECSYMKDTQEGILKIYSSIDRINDQK